MKKILVVGDGIDGSGLTEVIFNVFSNFNDEITFVSYSDKKDSNVRKRCKALNWNLVKAPVVTKNPLKHWSFWNRFFKKNTFDIAYFNYSSSWNFLPVVFAKKSGIKEVICHSHNSNYSHSFSNKSMMYLLNRLNDVGKKKISKYSDIHIATSPEAANWMFGTTKDVFISKNGVNLSKFKFNADSRVQIRKRYNIKNKDKVVGMIGVLEKRKNPFFTLEIFKKLKVDNKKLVIIGKGSLDKEIKQRVQEMNLKDKVIYISHSEEVNKWYSALDLLLFPSLFEGLPLVMIEAQASGLSIIGSSNITKEAFLNSNVYRYGLDDKKRWVKTGEELLDSASRSMLNKNFKKYSSRYQAKNIKRVIESNKK